MVNSSINLYSSFFGKEEVRKWRKNIKRSPVIVKSGVQRHYTARKRTARWGGRGCNVLLMFLSSWPSDFRAGSRLQQLRRHYIQPGPSL